MSLRPERWNVIVVGRWNRSIFTPERIGKRLFGLDDPQQLEVLVPMDGVSPYLVKDPRQGLIVTLEGTRLEITLEQWNFESLRSAMETGVKVLDWLPETPVTAVGFNVRYQSDEMSPDLAGFVRSSADGALASLGYDISGRTVGRSVPFGDGVLNLSFAQGTDGSSFACNFHRAASAPGDLREWLSMPIERISEAVRDLVGALSLDIEERVDVADRE